MGLIMQNGISYGGADIVKLTQTEYDALPESKYSDGILYAITDGEGSSGGTSKPVELTKAQYEALGESTKTDGILYAITDGDELSAKNLEYDGSQTGLGNNVQGAIDKLNSNLPFKFGIDGDGNYGYYGADGSLIPFLGTISFKVVLNGTNSNISTNTPFIYENNKYKYLKIVYGGYMNCTVKGDSTTLYSRADGSYVTGVTKICDISSYSKISVSGSNTGYTNATVELTFSSSPLS